MKGIKTKNKKARNKTVKRNKKVNKNIKRSFLSLPIFIIPVKISALICINLWLIFLVSCQSKPTDLRNLTPADSIIYLETNDLGGTLEALTESRAFKQLAEEKNDFSALENVQLAVAVTGFETAELPSGEGGEGGAILSFKPRFIAVADTHAWNFNAVSIAETQIGRFARAVYGETVRLDKSEKGSAKFFVWTNAADGRKIFAAVENAVIYAGNDEKLIDKCLDVGRGKAESLLKNERLAQARAEAAKSGENQIAFGYVAPAGVARISEFAAVSTAVGATEDDDGRNFIARVVPQILQKSVREISWTATKNENGITDEIVVATNADASRALRESMRTNEQRTTTTNAAQFLPSDVFTATRYNLKNPQAAWRALLSATVKQTDLLTGKFLAQFSNSLLEPFGVTDAELFLSRVEEEIYTARLDAEGEKSIAVVRVRDAEAVKKSIGAIDFKAAPERRDDALIWKSADGDFAAAFIEDKLILGDAQSVSECLRAAKSGRNFTKNQYFQKLNLSPAAAVTYSKDPDSTKNVVRLLGKVKDESENADYISLTETSFTEKGIERRSASAFGLIGSILEKVGESEKVKK